MPLQPLTNFEIQKYYQNQLRFKSFIQEKFKIKDGAYVINLDKFKSIGIHWITAYVNADNVIHFKRNLKIHRNKKIQQQIFIFKDKSSVRSYAMRHNDASKMTSTPCHMRHSQNFDKIENFLKPVLKIFILRKLTEGWGKRVVKEGARILHQIYSFRGRINGWGE